MNRKLQKLLEKIKQKPTPNDIKFSEFNSLLLALGAKRREGKGDHVVYFLNGRVISIPQNREVKAVYIRKVLGVLR